MNRGYVILAQNNSDVDYVQCARTLCQNIKTRMPGSSVTLLTDCAVDAGNFDHVILFPHGDQCQDQEWKLANDWQVYDASPYEYTIKLEADMYLPRNIDHWWDTLTQHDLVLMQHIRKCDNTLSDCKFYRKFVEANQLPDIYNAITYFRRSDRAQMFFAIVRDVFEHWQDYMQVFRDCGQLQPSTDYVYSIAAHIMGPEHCTLPNWTDFSMIHMKQYINALFTADWTNQLIYELDAHSFRIQTVPQMYPVHYHVKKFCHEIQKIF